MRRRRGAPTGATVLFTSNRTGAQNVYFALVDGDAPPRRIGNASSGMFYPSLSADGRTLVAVRYDADGDHVGVAPFDTSGAAPTPLDSSFLAPPYAAAVSDTLGVYVVLTLSRALAALLAACDRVQHAERPHARRVHQWQRRDRTPRLLCAGAVRSVALPERVRCGVRIRGAGPAGHVAGGDAVLGPVQRSHRSVGWHTLPSYARDRISWPPCGACASTPPRSRRSPPGSCRSTTRPRPIRCCRCCLPITRATLISGPIGAAAGYANAATPPTGVSPEDGISTNVACDLPLARRRERALVAEPAGVDERLRRARARQLRASRAPRARGGRGHERQQSDALRSGWRERRRRGAVARRDARLAAILPGARLHRGRGER